MIYIEKYYVVKRTEQKDELYSMIEAASLEEVNAIFHIRYKEEINKMKKGDAFYIFSEKGKLKFGENNRLIFPKEVYMTGIQMRL